jgi:hypothetical protein
MTLAVGVGRHAELAAEDPAEISCFTESYDPRYYSQRIACLKQQAFGIVQAHAEQLIDHCPANDAPEYSTQVVRMAAEGSGNITGRDPPMMVDHYPLTGTLGQDISRFVDNLYRACCLSEDEGDQRIAAGLVRSAAFLII